MQKQNKTELLKFLHSHYKYSFSKCLREYLLFTFWLAVKIMWYYISIHSPLRERIPQQQILTWNSNQMRILYATVKCHKASITERQDSCNFTSNLCISIPVKIPMYLHNPHLFAFKDWAILPSKKHQLQKNSRSSDNRK